jgi:hypothetical protein
LAREERTRRETSDPVQEALGASALTLKIGAVFADAGGAGKAPKAMTIALKIKYMINERMTETTPASLGNRGKSVRSLQP